MSKKEEEQSVAGVRFTPQPFQEPFLYSPALLPCRIAPWGDGKTLCMIIKGLILSMMYPGNQGLLIRKKYKALQKSTISEFQKWTHLNVPDQKQMVVLPGFGSEIYFSHAESLTDFEETLQGMNLGWAAIEQAEELDSPDVIDMLKGRVRRILTPNQEIQRRLIEIGAMDDYVERFEIFDKETREEIERRILADLGLPVRQIITIANAKGHNWLWKRWVKPHLDGEPLEDHEYHEGKPFENIEHIPNTTKRMWEQLKIIAPKKYNRLVLNSHEDYDIEGAYYAALMSDALKDRRCEIDGLFDVAAPVYTWWDLGIRGADSTSIWFVQFVGMEIHLIDFYSNKGKGMNFYSQILTEKNYDYAEHWLPHDARSGMQGAEVTTRLDILRDLREAKHEDVYVVDRHSVAERHEAVRSLLNKCKFDSKCEVGVEALNNYHQEINKAKTTEEHTIYLDSPAKDQYSHPADAFGYMAICWRYQTIGGESLGRTGAQREWVDDDNVVGVTDLLEISP